MLTPALSLGNPLQKLVLVVKNNTNKKISYCDIYAPNEPPDTIQNVIVTPRRLTPHQQTKITIFFSGTAGLAASANFTDNNTDALTFGFNDPWQYYPGGETYFETTNPQLSASSTPTLNPKIAAKALLCTKVNYQLQD